MWKRFWAWLTHDDFICNECGQTIPTHQTPTQYDLNLCDDCWSPHKRLSADP